MKCPRCNSENIQMQSKESNPKLVLPICLVCGGIGLIFLSVIGFILGVLVGLLVSLIIKSLLPKGYVSVMVCQNCGYIVKPITQKIAKTDGHPLFCTDDVCNLVLVRDNSQIGSIIPLTIMIDNYSPFFLQNDMVVNLNLSIGNHTLSYCQQKGLRRKKRSGSITVNITETKQTVRFVFTADGLLVR